MTEAEWLACKDPDDMLGHLGARASPRKLRYFLVACARKALPAHADAAMLQALTVAEQFADGECPCRTLIKAREALRKSHAARVKRWSPRYTDNIRSVPAWHATREQIVRAAREGAECCAWSSTRKKTPGGLLTMTYPDRELAAQSRLLRDNFGNPFHRVRLDPSWLTATVVALARGIYEERAFDRVPILADALQDAGCDSDDILNHCRQDTIHARGCWVVDLVLGRH